MIAETLTQSLIYFLDLLKVSFCFRFLFSFDLKLTHRKIVFSALLIIVATIFLVQTPALKLFFSTALVILLFILISCFTGKLRFQNFFLFIVSYIAICQLDIFIGCTIDLFFSITNTHFRSSVVACSSFLLFYLLCRLCHAKGIHIEKQNYTAFISCEIIFLLLMAGFLGAVGNLVKETPAGFYHDVLYFNICALSLLISFSGFLLFFLLQSNRRYQEIQSLQTQLYQAQKDYASQVQSQNHILRSFRHDVRNHMIALRHHLKTGDIDSALAYIDEIDRRISVSALKYHTKNPIADALLNAKAAKMEEAHIVCTLSGSLPTHLPLTDFDLCQLISNLLNNAVEANLRLPAGMERFIRFEMAYLPSCFSLRVSNPIAETSDLKTKKKDKANHGIGLKNIAACADRYHGSFEIFQKDMVFTVEIIFPGIFPVSDAVK